jgi:hypothetical protein
MRSRPSRAAARLSAALAVAACSTALVAALPAGAATDRPNTYAAAVEAAVSPGAIALRSTIDGPRDQDWFKFSVTRATKAAVTLGSLPGNYSLAVYDGAGRRIALSAHTGTHFERVFPDVAPGTYYVRVATQGDWSRTKAYMLRFRPLPTGLVTLDQYAKLTGSRRVVATIFNNSGTWKWISQVDYVWYDRDRRVLRRDSGGMTDLTWIVPPHRAMPFDWVGSAPPAGAVSVSVKAIGGDVRRPGTPAVIKASGVRTRYVTGTRPYTEVSGTASSPSTRRVQAWVLAEAYNANGTLIDVADWPVLVGAGRTERFSPTLDVRAPNAVRVHGLAGYGQPVPVGP